MKQNKTYNSFVAWFEKADNDLKSATILLKEHGSTETICFLCQQIAEKYLKGFLVFKEIKVGELRKWHIHDLPRLREKCQQIDNSFRGIEEECYILNKYYIETRYPIDPPLEYSKSEAKIALQSAEKVRNFIIGRTTTKDR